MIETVALISFGGLVLLTAYKVYFFAQPKNFQEKAIAKQNYWVSLLAFVGVLFFFGLFFVSYMSSFGETTTIAQGTTTTTVTSNAYYFLTYMTTIAVVLLFLASGLIIMETIQMLVQSGFAFARGSKV